MSELAGYTECSVISGRLQATLALEALKKCALYPEGQKLLAGEIEAYDLHAELTDETKPLVIAILDHGQMRLDVTAAVQRLYQGRHNTKDEWLTGESLVVALEKQSIDVPQGSV